MLPGNFPQKVKMIMQFNSCNFSDCFNVFFNVVPSVGIFLITLYGLYFSQFYTLMLWLFPLAL